MELAWSAHSEIGLVRKDNQDSGYASAHLLLVADGMGGAARGDLASAVAVDAVSSVDQSARGEDMLTELRALANAANDALADLVRDDPELDGTGTTLCGAMFDGEQFGIVHIGDSRGYLLRGDQLIRLTTDHSWVQSLIDDGKITPAEALRHPHRNLLLKVLNGHPNNTPDLALHDAQPGDRVLFCSDGLCGLVDDERIGALLSIPHRTEALQQLISAAHEAGGVDNITIVMGDVVVDAPAQEPVVLGAAASVEIPSTAAVASESTTTTLPRAAATEPTTANAPTPPTSAAGGTAALSDEPLARSPRHRGWLVWVLTALVTVGVLAGAAALGYRTVQSRYFVGTNDERVAIFRGTPDKIGPLRINSLEETTPTLVTDLPPRYQDDVRSHQYQDQSLDSARTTVATLADRASACKRAREDRARATAAPSPSPSESPTPTESATPGDASASASASVSATPSPSPSAAPTPPAAPSEC